MSNKLTLLGQSISSATIKAMNDFLDVTGYVYGVVNLVTPAVNLESKYDTDQHNYDVFRTNLSVYIGQAGLWIQPTSTQSNDIVTQITAMPEVITGISSIVISDINTLKALGPGNSLDSTFSGPAKTLIKAAKAQVDGLITQITTFKSEVDAGNQMMTTAYKGILTNVDSDLAGEISSLHTTISSLKSDVKAARKKITAEDIGKGFAIGAIVIGALTVWTGVGALVLGAGIAGVILTEEEIKALKAKISLDKTKINNDFNQMGTDSAAKAAVVLFQKAVEESLEAHDNAITELTKFSTLLSTLQTEIDDAYSELNNALGTTVSKKWNTDLDSALTAWTSADQTAKALAKIKVKATPYSGD